MYYNSKHNNPFISLLVINKHRSRVLHVMFILFSNDKQHFATVISKIDKQKGLFQICINKYKEVNKEFVIGRSVWIDEDGVKMICNLLHPSMKVLEYGSGGSTTLFGSFVSKWISVEHDKKWGKLIEKYINGLNLQDYKIY